MDEAIQHSQKASAKKLVKRVFGKNTDEADRILLSEKDFNIDPENMEYISGSRRELSCRLSFFRFTFLDTLKYNVDIKEK